MCIDSKHFAMAFSKATQDTLSHRYVCLDLLLNPCSASTNIALVESSTLLTMPFPVLEI